MNVLRLTFSRASAELIAHPLVTAVADGVLLRHCLNYRIGSCTALGWLRQEENQYLTIPADIADSYPGHVRRLMGYQSYGDLGVYPDDPDGNFFRA